MPGIETLQRRAYPSCINTIAVEFAYGIIAGMKIPGYITGAFNCYICGQTCINSLAVG
jgi:hypothetical protein